MKRKLLNKTTVKLPQKYDKLGKYEVLLSYKNDSVKAKVEIVDTIPPVFETVDNMTVPLGTQYTDEQLKEMFKVSDADEYELKIDNGGYNANAEGVYTITAEAKDKTGNSTKYSFTITVTAAVTEIQYTENTTQAESTVTEQKKLLHLIKQIPKIRQTIVVTIILLQEVTITIATIQPMAEITIIQTPATVKLFM